MALPGVIFGKIGQLNKKLKLKVELYKAQKVLLNSPKMDNLLYLEALPQAPVGGFMFGFLTQIYLLPPWMDEIHGQLNNMLLYTTGH